MIYGEKCTVAIIKSMVKQRNAEIFINLTMEDGFPDPDGDLYDLIHEDEYEVLNELEGSSKKKEEVSKQPVQKNPGSQKILSSNSNEAPDLVLPSQSGITANEATKKRTFEELFGDVTDLLGDDILHVHEHKEKRPRWDEPEEVIKQVLEARRILHTQNNYVSIHQTAQDFEEEKLETISFRVPSWNFMPVTRPSDSERYYVRVRSHNKFAVTKNRPKMVTGLLSVSYSRLKAEAEEIIVKNAEEATLLATEPDVQISSDDKLWVDKYRPQKYIELLSDEGVNRKFLHWLKLWDKIVFNREPITRQKVTEMPKFGTKKFIKNKPIEGRDSKGFPEHRIALLTGPPGLGKTTLAHLVARHAGYNIVEVNASDDRSPDNFRQALLASTEMKAVMGADPRPNCLILDEIDGAPATSIDILLKFIHGKLTSKSKKGKNKEEKGEEPCRRPIICICNELYTPSLRALRMAALVIQVPEVSASRLAERLGEIARKECIRADADALLQLAEKSGCDVRTCLGALQYMGGAKSGNTFNLVFKDTKKGLFDSWKEILQVPWARNRVIPARERMERILKVVFNSETNRLALGIFHNYPQIQNNSIVRLSDSLQWFQFFDRITTFVMNTQIWSAMPYANYAFVAWHFNLAANNNIQLSYPSVMYEVNQKLAKNQSILATVHRVSGIETSMLTIDYCPLLSELLTPRLRSVSGHLYSSNEKAELTRLVNVMLDLGLALVQEKNPDGSYEYNFEPNLLEIGLFPDCKKRKSLAYAVKQIVVQEYEMERLKRLERMTSGSSKLVSTPTATDKKRRNIEATEKLKEASEITNAVKSVANHHKKLEPVVPQPEKMQCRDFFGRIISNDRQQQSANKISPRAARLQDMVNRNRVWYKYKEGFSNAVRRTVLMRDLL
ncbi:chromosome transmission fidelity protein 18 homolog isoform X2 [Cephus cinctus]|uniref:Chromosome transmission fidelity protein 18 homolog isoform X2 n=1 Tax=Cephus cinctus TaxID=211228 RepID=A0AAJ7BPX7_CEPCN|nr:chromosome transmission fidelity protein 18 homolog isoform X2 [Cephus cinctus]